MTTTADQIRIIKAYLDREYPGSCSASRDELIPLAAKPGEMLCDTVMRLLSEAKEFRSACTHYVTERTVVVDTCARDNGRAAIHEVTRLIDDGWVFRDPVEFVPCPTGPGYAVRYHLVRERHA